jgi:hypothetical protein
LHSLTPSLAHFLYIPQPTSNFSINHLALPGIDVSTVVAMDSLFSDVMNDWSGTGRGCHVDFGADEVIPLQTGKSSSSMNVILVIALIYASFCA